MNCIDCKAPNPEDNRYCGKCGAELGRTLDETVRKKGFRDRQATELEIAESVSKRVMLWATTFLALLAIVVGRGCMEVRDAVSTGKSQIQSAVDAGKKEIEGISQQTGALRKDVEQLQKVVEQLQSDVKKFKQVNDEIQKLQKRITTVQGQVVDLGNKTLRVKSIEGTDTGPAALSFLTIGCRPSDAAKTGLTYCAQGSPPSLFQMTPNGDATPVAGLSPAGFRDSSSGPRPNCAPTSRGTIYIEKGSPRVADKPFLCAKKSDDKYDWIALGNVP